VSASTDRLHDYERVMSVNYFGAVRMVLALLPHCSERRFGHVVNVSSAGVQANNPKYSDLPAQQGRPGRVRRGGRHTETFPTTSPSPTSTCRWCAPPMIAPSHG
jgi:NAD(P)-dependent dehydrogenase (short-subunit alcohol dehydrogenase family)